MGRKGNRRGREEDNGTANQPSSSAPKNAAAPQKQQNNNNNTSTSNNPANFPNRPQVTIALNKARRSNIAARDVGTLVSQALLPFEDPNYPVIEASSQWFQLQHQRDIPAAVVINVPGLPLEAIVAPGYLQPERIEPVGDEKKEQQPQQEDAAAASATTKKGEDKKDDDKKKHPKEEEEEKVDADDQSPFANAFPADFNPWLRHVRAMPNVSCAKLWLSANYEDANICTEFFFRLKAGVTNKNKRGNRNEPTPLAPSLEIAKAVLDGDAAAKKNGETTKSNNSNNKDDNVKPDAAAAALLTTKTTGIITDFKSAKKVEEEQKEETDEWDTIWDVDAKKELLDEIALDVTGLRQFCCPFETDGGTRNHPDTREYSWREAEKPLDFETGDGQSANPNSVAARMFADEEDEATVAEARRRRMEEEDAKLNIGGSGGNISMMTSSALEPLPPYKRMWAQEKQCAALDYLRACFGSLRAAAASGTSAPSPSSPLIDEQLASEIYVLAQELLHDIKLTEPPQQQQNEDGDDDDENINNTSSNSNRRNRTVVSVLDEFFFPSSSSSASSSFPPTPTSLAVDCEMIQTECWGSTLARLTVLAVHPGRGRTLFDVLVKPQNPVTDYVSAYSGILPADLADIRLSLASARLLTMCIASRTSYFVGHSLENDFIVLRLAAEEKRVLDTAALFPNPRGLPYRNSLKSLAFSFLEGRAIQTGRGGHDSVEDAKTAMDLVALKLKNGPQFGLPNRVNVQTWWSNCGKIEKKTSNDKKSTDKKNGAGGSDDDDDEKPLPPPTNIINNNNWGPIRIFSHLIDKPRELRRVSIADTNAIHSSNDGTTSHRAQKLLLKIGKTAAAAPADATTVTKNFVWTQLYDAALRDEVEEENNTTANKSNTNTTGAAAAAAEEDKSATTKTTTTTEEEKEKKESAAADDDGENAVVDEAGLSKMLREHVTTIHRRIHRIINAAPDKSLICITAFAHPNSVTVQERHPQAHGMVFCFIKDANVTLPEGDDMFEVSY